MIIGVDGNEANIEKRVGVNVYAFELLRSIYKLRSEWMSRNKFVIYLKGSPRDDMPVETEWWQYKVIPGGSFWIVRKLMFDLISSKPRPDLFFTPSHYAPPITLMPHACSIMDLGYLESMGQFTKKDLWQLRLWTAWSIVTSKTVFAISESTKRDISKHYSIAKSKTVVTHLGYDKEKFNLGSKNDNPRVREKYGIKGDYILFLSTLKPSKNISGLLEAFKLLIPEFTGISLVLAGKKGWMYDDVFAKIKALNLEKRVIFTDFLPEDDKPGLIAGAKLFVLPSFWEGFGIDVLSSLACGVPVVVSKIGSLPEVVGEAGVYVNPHDITSIYAGIKKVLSMDKKEYNILVKQGLAQAENFSWEKTARGTLKGLNIV
ncbi:MAG: glycosyltransferase family 1 protein [Patescibacteria group bacterium]